MGSILDEEEVLRLSARIALAEGDGDLEARILKQIVDLDPLDGDALLLLGRHAVRTSNDAAIFYFERAMAIDASVADANLGLGKLLSAQGKYAEALPNSPGPANQSSRACSAVLGADREESRPRRLNS